MPISIEKTISEFQRVDSVYGLFNINIHCRSVSTSAVSSYAASTDTGVFHGERLQFSKITNRGVECRTELMNIKYPLKQRKDTNTRSNQLLIAPDASLKGWCAYCQRRKADGLWTSLEKNEHINVLELTAAKYATLTFTQLNPFNKINPCENGQHSFPVISDQNEGNTKQNFVSVEQKHSGIFNGQGNHDYWGVSSRGAGQGNRFPVTERKGVKRVETKPNSFSKNLSSVGTPDLDLFGSQVSHQVPAYVSWKLNPYNKSMDAFQTLWSHLRSYTFPPFPFIGGVLCKVLIDQTYLISVTTMSLAQSWYLRLKYHFFLSKMPDLLVGPNRENYYLIKLGNL